jgi:hypothetical protein
MSGSGARSRCRGVRRSGGGGGGGGETVAWRMSGSGRRPRARRCRDHGVRCHCCRHAVEETEEEEEAQWTAAAAAPRPVRSAFSALELLEVKERAQNDCSIRAIIGSATNLLVFTRRISLSSGRRQTSLYLLPPSLRTNHQRPLHRATEHKMGSTTLRYGPLCGNGDRISAECSSSGGTVGLSMCWTLDHPPHPVDRVTRCAGCGL